MKKWFINYKKKFLKQVEIDRQTNYKKKFKERFKSDWNNFKRFINIFGYFHSFHTGIGAIIACTFFPYLVILWCLICIYEALFIYSFMLLDVIIFKCFKKWLRLHIIYSILRTVLFVCFYNPLFVYVPNILDFLVYMTTLEFWYYQFEKILKFFFNIFLFFAIPVYKLIAWVDNYERNYDEWKGNRQMKRQLAYTEKREQQQKKMKAKNERKLWYQIQKIHCIYYKKLFFIWVVYKIGSVKWFLIKIKCRILRFFLGIYLYCKYKLRTQIWYWQLRTYKNKILNRARWTCWDIELFFQKMYQKRFLYWKDFKLILQIIYYDFLINLHLSVVLFIIWVSSGFQQLRCFELKYYIFASIIILGLFCIIFGIWFYCLIVTLSSIFGL